MRNEEDRATPAQEWMQRMKLAVMNAVSEDDIRVIVRNLVDRAKKGDRAALAQLVAWIGPLTPPPAAKPQRVEHVIRRVPSGGKPRPKAISYREAQ